MTALKLLTEDEKFAYLDNPYGCPYCHGEDLDGEGVDIEEDQAFWQLYCRSCGRVWKNVYVLHKILESLEGGILPAPQPVEWDGS